MNRTSESDLNQSDLITDIHCNGQQCLLMNGGAQSAIGHSHCTFLPRVSIMMIKTRLARDPGAKCCWLKTLPLRDALQQSSVTLAHGVRVGLPPRPSRVYSMHWCLAPPPHALTDCLPSTPMRRRSPRVPAALAVPFHRASPCDVAAPRLLPPALRAVSTD